MVDSTPPSGRLALLAAASDDPDTDLPDVLTMFADTSPPPSRHFLGVTVTPG